MEASPLAIPESAPPRPHTTPPGRVPPVPVPPASPPADGPVPPPPPAPDAPLPPPPPPARPLAHQLPPPARPLHELPPPPARSRPLGPPLLGWRSVSKSFGSVRALDDVSIEVRAGEVLGLLGPNGAGKSTLLGLVTGLERPDRGSVALAPHVRPGFMPQEYALYPTLSAWENAIYVARSHGMRRREARAAVEQAIELVGLSPHLHQRVKGFSGGMRRRLSLAIAMLGSPRVLILDEPTVGVDPQSRVAVLDLIAQARDEGTAIVYSTHYMEEVQALADRVAILHEGSLLCTGPVSEIVARHGETQLDLEVMTESPDRLSELLVRTEAFVRVEAVEADGQRVRYRLIVRDGASAFGAALQTVNEAGATVVDARMRDATLAAAFIALTGRELRD